MNYQVVILSADGFSVEVQQSTYIKDCVRYYKSAIAKGLRCWVFDLNAFNNDGSSVQISQPEKPRTLAMLRELF